MNPVVYSQGWPTTECFPTHTTFVRFLSGVNSPVQGKSYVNTEDFPTISAIKWLLSSMIMPKVASQGHVVPEGLPTLNTLKGSFVIVTSLMLSKGRTVPEGLPTLLTLVWFLPSVNPLMLSQVCRLPEGFCTFLALIWFFSSMDSLMYNKVWILAKGFLTFLTLIRFFMGMCRLMLSKVVTLLERLSADCAFIWFFTSVDSLMNSNRWAMCEGFLAFVTFKNVPPWPDFLVSSYLEIFGKAFLIWVVTINILFYTIQMGRFWRFGVFVAYFFSVSLWVTISFMLNISWFIIRLSKRSLCFHLFPEVGHSWLKLVIFSTDTSSNTNCFRDNSCVLCRDSPSVTWLSLLVQWSFLVSSWFLSLRTTVSWEVSPSTLSSPSWTLGLRVLIL